MMRAALGYVRYLGLRVLPLRPGGKEPLTPHGVHDATADPDTAREYWVRWPLANIGLACGSGIVVVDVDPRNGGDETLRSLEEAHAPLPRTWTSATGGGGWHFVYRAQSHAGRLRPSLGPGIDLKGDGGYIVVPPSRHPTGQLYQWYPGLHPLRAPICRAPEWILALARGSQRRKAAPPMGHAANSFLARAFLAAGWAGKEIDGDRVCVRCPWVIEHTDGRGAGEDSSTVVFAPTQQTPLGYFHCSHSHCADRSTADVLRMLPLHLADALAASFSAEFDTALRIMRCSHAA